MDKSPLDLAFAALAHPTRRAMLEQLAKSGGNVSDLVARYDMSQPAISKHLRVLERAGLVQQNTQGREHHFKVDPAPMDDVNGWIGLYARLWGAQFDAVAEYLERREMKTDVKKETPDVHGN